jgi:uncharacterized protein
MMISQALIEAAKSAFVLDLEYGVHGLVHWARVRNNGLMLAPLTGANAEIVLVLTDFVARAEKRQN